MAIAQDNVKHLQLWAGRIGHFFLVLASVICGYAGWVWGGDFILKSVVFALFMAACPWAVAYLLPFVSVARQSGRAVVATFMMVAVAIAGLMEIQGELMVFAGQRNTSSVNATMQQTRYEDARSAVKDIERQLKVAQAKLEEQSPYGPSAAYEAQIKNADDRATLEAQKRGGKGKNYDLAASQAADLRAKQNIALDREQNTEPSVKRLTEDLASARAAAANTKAGDSMSAAQSASIAALWTMSLDPSADAKRWTDLLVGAFTAVFMLVIPTCLIYAHKIDWTSPTPTKRAGNLLTAVASLRAWMSGVPAPVSAVDPNITNRLDEISAQMNRPKEGLILQVRSLADVRRAIAVAKAA